MNFSYDVVYININSVPDWYTKKCITGKVPAIELPATNEVIFDSTIIAQYLDDKFPSKRLLPKDITEKYKDLMFIEYFSEVISALNSNLISFGRHSIDKEETLKQGLDMFEKELENRGVFYGGKQPGLVDYFVWPWVERSDLIKLFRTKLDLRKENFQHIMQWHKNMMDNQAVKKHIMNIETHAKFLQTYCSGVPLYDF